MTHCIVSLYYILHLLTHTHLHTSSLTCTRRPSHTNARTQAKLIEIVKQSRKELFVQQEACRVCLCVCSKGGSSGCLPGMHVCLCVVVKEACRVLVFTTHHNCSRARARAHTHTHSSSLSILFISLSLSLSLSLSFSLSFRHTHCRRNEITSLLPHTHTYTNTHTHTHTHTHRFSEITSKQQTRP